MDLSKYKNADLIRHKMLNGVVDDDKPVVRKRSKPVLVRPGAWFQAVLTVLLIPFWLPSILNLFGCYDLASRIIHGCMSCNKRKKLMDRNGWLGLPKLLARKEFWTRDKFGWIWSRNQTTITS